LQYAVQLRALHSFPTRRSSDLQQSREVAAAVGHGGEGPVEVDRVRGNDAPDAGEADEEEQLVAAVVDLGNHYRSAEGTVVVVVADRKSTRLNSSHVAISYAVFC